MNKKTLETLEFDKVLNYLSAHALSELGVKRCLEASVFEDVNTIKKELLLTTQARTILIMQLMFLWKIFMILKMR